MSPVRGDGTQISLSQPHASGITQDYILHFHGGIDEGGFQGSALANKNDAAVEIAVLIPEKSGKGNTLHCLVKVSCRVNGVVTFLSSPFIVLWRFLIQPVILCVSINKRKIVRNS